MSERRTVCHCPFCGKPVYQFKTGYRCKTCSAKFCILSFRQERFLKMSSTHQGVLEK